MSFNKQKVDTLIIGAGLSGITLANELKRQGRSSLIIEKSRSVGGRLASRRIGDNIFDHGAQHVEVFSSSPAEFQKFVMSPSDCLLWDKKGDHSYYSYQQGVTSLLKHHSHDLHIAFNTKIIEILKSQGVWQLKDENLNLFSANNVVLTAPLTQSLILMKGSKLSYPAELEQVSYAKKIVILLNLKKSENYRIKSTYFKKIYLQNTKRNNTDTTYTLVTSDDFSNQHFELDESTITQKILSLFETNSTVTQNLIDLQIKKWRYAYPLNGLNVSSIEPHENLHLIGDVFAGEESFNAMDLKIIAPKFNPTNNSFKSAFQLARKLNKSIFENFSEGQIQSAR